MEVKIDTREDSEMGGLYTLGVKLHCNNFSDIPPQSLHWGLRRMPPENIEAF